MSEYQYYEFQALDRPLTQPQMAELRTYSSRARITSTSFVNEYNWGSFKGNAAKWMEMYFDAFLYVANWGSHWLEFRVPERLLDPETVSMYCTKERTPTSRWRSGNAWFARFNTRRVPVTAFMAGNGGASANS